MLDIKILRRITEHPVFYIAYPEENIFDVVNVGLNVVVSFPTEVYLSLDENKAFSSSDTIYALGIGIVTVWE